jgi:hypothetical protein
MSSLSVPYENPDARREPKGGEAPGTPACSEERRAPLRQHAARATGSKTVVKNSISFMSRPRKAMSEWVVHCEVNQLHIRRSHATREAALKDACSQLLQGHAVNRIVGPQKTITGERVRDWCAKHRP